MTAVHPVNPKHARKPKKSQHFIIAAPKADPISALSPGDARETLARVKQYFKQTMKGGKK